MFLSSEKTTGQRQLGFKPHSYQGGERRGRLSTGERQNPGLAGAGGTLPVVGGWTGMQTGGWTGGWMDIQTGGWTGGRVDMQTGGWTGGWAGRCMDRPVCWQYKWQGSLEPPFTLSGQRGSRKAGVPEMGQALRARRGPCSAGSPFGLQVGKLERDLELCLEVLTRRGDAE